MPADAPTIVATSMGFNRARDPWRPGPVFRYAFDLAGAGTRPRICLVATAGGDQAATIGAFHQAFTGSGVRASHLALFDQPNVPDVREHLLAHDVIWVDRGSLVNLLAVWRAHGLDAILRECWQAGVVLGGESAGSLCWHTGRHDRLVRAGAARRRRPGVAAVLQRRALHQTPRTVPSPRRHRHAPRRVRGRRRRRARLPGNRTRRSDLRPAQRERLPGHPHTAH